VERIEWYRDEYFDDFLDAVYAPLHRPDWQIGTWDSAMRVNHGDVPCH